MQVESNQSKPGDASGPKNIGNDLNKQYQTSTRQDMIKTISVIRLT